VKPTSLTLLNNKALCSLLAAFCLLSPVISYAHGGEDHSESAPTPVSLPVAGPRLELKSPDVELLGTILDGTLTLYADRYASNEPIVDAKIELESAGNKVLAQAGKDGTYTATADWLKQPGKHEVVVSVEADGLADLLVGTFEIPALQPETVGRTWFNYGKWAVGFVALALAFVVLWWLVRRRKGLVAPAALSLVAVVLLGGHNGPSFAHGDEDHSDKSKPVPAAAVVSGLPVAQSSPVRLPDGSIFAPKPVQRLINIRTVLGESRDIARTFELNGQISADPNFSGHVQSSQSGRIVAPADGFPTLGMKVSKGQILVYIEPAASNIEKGNQQAQLAELASNLLQAEKRVQRLEQLVGSVPQKEIDAARAEAASLNARKQAVAASLFQSEALRAPVSGVVSRADVVAGQVVEAKEVLFEVIDPTKLRVEAVAYDTALAGKVASAFAVTADNQTLTLKFIGQSYQLREQALPMQFTVKPPFPPLSVGQPVTVLAKTRQTFRGIAVPQSSVVRSGSGETIVWLHVSAERFVPKKVKVQPLDGNTVAVLEGLHDGDRLVTQGAALLSQIR